ncbi:MAG TPA: hypothetical protein VF690_03030 [Hymenobacter sp.]|jgi:hypothetical protein
MATIGFDYPVYRDLTPSQACWYPHGVCIRAPETAKIIQPSAGGAVISWQTHTAHGGTLLAITPGSVVEHGVEQFTRLDRLTKGSSGKRPVAACTTIDATAYAAQAAV